ncbi:hypothetical protein C1646_767945 [Rhizophagus diaphanus]|nr:hypothetical protein C1646_767945 [Rhizophagus diaphanus] [Rhizophagus sp. MUCL 43196]
MRDHKLNDSSFQLLLQKCGGYLENFGNEFKDQIIYLLFDLIENMKQNLNYLSISVFSCENFIECSSIVLQNLGQVIPFKLEYLYISIHIKNMSDFEVFLKNSQDTLIYMKKKRVKYLAIRHFFVSTSDDEVDENCCYKELASMKDEVENLSYRKGKI